MQTSIGLRANKCLGLQNTRPRFAVYTNTCLSLSMDQTFVHRMCKPLFGLTESLTTVRVEGKSRYVPSKGTYCDSPHVQIVVCASISLHITRLQFELHQT